MVKDIAFGIIISLLFISLVVLFCVILIKLYIQKIKKYNQQLFQNEIHFQKTLNTSILETQEQLLTSISQDLHDDAGQQLTVINFQLENLKLDYPNCTNDLNPISESVTKLSQSLRDISHSLNTNWLEKNGLIDAIKKEVNRLKKNKSITVNLKIDAIEKTFKNEEQIVIFRIFQELINNILKHAKATKIEICITNNTVFTITISDNGIGFDTNKKTNSIGIQNCINRAKIIQYTFTINSQPNTGTTVILEENK
jgi:signal transduction histidine kinase